MEATRSHYAGLAWPEDPADAEAYKHESFDLVLHRDGEVKHVEVKGTTQTTGLPDSSIQVSLTPNEVAHARGECKAVVTYRSVALFILTDVKITPDTDGALAAVGGTPRIYDPWNLADGTLKPTGPLGRAFWCARLQRWPVGGAVRSGGASPRASASCRIDRRNGLRVRPCSMSLTARTLSPARLASSSWVSAATARYLRTRRPKLLADCTSAPTVNCLDRHARQDEQPHRQHRAHPNAQIGTRTAGLWCGSPQPQPINVSSKESVPGSSSYCMVSQFFSRQPPADCLQNSGELHGLARSGWGHWPWGTAETG